MIGGVRRPPGSVQPEKAQNDPGEHDEADKVKEPGKGQRSGKVGIPVHGRPACLAFALASS